MSKTIDERVVSMQFDNRHFETNVRTTMSTLDKLKASLRLDGAAKNLNSISASAGKVNLNPLSRGVEAVSTKFSALEIMGVTALANITNSAVNAGKRIVSALTIDPVKTGFQEYETQINAVQTILANTKSKGSDINDVNKALDELNKYADMTIYNFTEMTRNIGTFTAAGVDLDTSVAAIQGIANLAAVSGSTSQQASTAMYQLSQALASGTVKLMDWNSVVNAGMGGEVFQTALKKTSELLGTGAEAAIEAEGSFRESLRTGWLTSEVLTETLKKFTTSGAVEYLAEYTGQSEEAINSIIKETDAWSGEKDAIDAAAEALAKKSGKNKDEIMAALDMAATAQNAATKVKTLTQLWDVLKESAQSGWSQTWKLIFGDFEEAKNLFSPLADTLTGFVNGMSDARNRVLEIGLAFTAPWEAITEKLSNFEGVVKKVTKLGGELEYFQKVVDKVWHGDLKNSDTGRYKLLEVEDIKASHEKFGLTMNQTTEETKKTAAAYESLSDAQLKDAGLTEEEIRLYRALEKEAEKRGMSIKELGDEMANTTGRDRLIESLKNFGSTLIEIGRIAKDAWVDVFNPPSLEEMGVKLYGLTMTIENFSKRVKGFFIDADTGLRTENADKLLRTFKGIVAIVKTVTSIMGGAFKLVWEVASRVLDGFGLNILDVTAAIGDVLVGIQKFITEGCLIEDIVSTIADGIIWLIKKIAELARSFAGLDIVQDTLAQFKQVGSDAIEGLRQGLSDGVAAIPGILVEVGKAMLAAIKGVLGIHSPSTEMREVGLDALKGLAQGVESGASRLWGKLKDLAETLLGYFKGIEWDKVFAFAVSASMIGILYKLVDAVGNIGEALGGFGNVLDELGDGIQRVSKAQAKKLNSEALLNMAKSIGILALALIALSFIPWQKLLIAGAALIVLAGILIGISFAMNKLNEASVSVGKDGFNIKGLKSGLIGIGVAILLLAGTVALIGKLDPEEAKQGFIGLAGVLTALIAFVGIYGKLVKGDEAKNIDKLGKMLKKLSVSLLLMVAVVKLISLLKPEELWKGAAFAAGFTIFVAALFAVSKGSSANADKVGSMILKVSFALGLLVGVCKLIDLLEYEEMGKGLIFALGFAAFVKALVWATKVDSGTQLAKISGLVLSVSIALTLMVGVCKLVGLLSTEDMIKGGAFVAAFVLLIKGLIKITKVGPEEQIGKVAGTLLAMSLAIGIMAGVSVLLGLIDIGYLAKGIIAIGFLSVFMSLMIHACKGVEDIKGSLIVMVVAIGIMATAVAALSLIPTKDLATSTGAMVALMAGFALMTASAKNIKGDMGMLKGLTMMTGVILVLTGMVVLLSEIDNPDKAIKNAGALSILLVSMSTAMLLLGKTSGSANTAAKSMIPMLAVVAGIAIILGVMSALDVEASIPSAVALGLLVNAMATAMLILSKVKMVDAASMTKSIIGLTAMVIPLSAFAAALQFIPMDNIAGKKEALLVLAAVMSAMSVLMLAVNAIGMIGNVKTMATGILGLTTMCALLAGFAWALNTVPMDSIAGKADSIMLLANVMGIMSALLVITSAVGAIYMLTGGIAATGLIGLAAMLGLFAGFAWALNEIPMDSVAANKDVIIMLTGIMKTLTELLLQVSIVAPLAAIGVVAMAGLTGLMVAIGLLAVGIGALMEKFPAVQEFLNTGLPVLVQLAGGIGEMIGSFVDGIISTVAAGLPEIGTNLSTFINNAMPFIAGVKLVDESVLTGVKTLAGAILLLTAADLVQGLVSFLPNAGSFADLGTQLSQFAINALPFFATVAMVNEGSMLGVKALAEALMIITASSLLERITSWVTGGTSMDTFATQLSQFGDAVVAFSSKVSGNIDESAVTAAANAGKSIAQLYDALPKTGGWMQTMFGEANIGTFASQLTAFGTAITGFSNKVKGNIDESAVTAATNAGKTIAELYNAIPKGGGWVQEMFGEANLETFGNQLVAFGTAITGFSSKVKGNIDEEAVTAAANAGSIMAKLANTLPTDGSVWDIFSSKDKMNFETFGEQLTAFGDALSDFSSSVSEGFNAESVTSATGAARKLINLFKSMSGIDTETVDTFKDAVKSLGKAKVEDFYKSFTAEKANNASSAVRKILNLIKSMVGLDSSGVTTFKNALKSLSTVEISGFVDAFSNAATKLAKAGTDMMNGLVKGINNGFPSAKNAVKRVADGLITTIKPAETKFSNSGKTMMQKFVEGLKQNASKARSAVKSAITQALAAITPAYSSFYANGKYLGAGLVEGINAKKTSAYNAGYALGRAAVQGEKDGQASNSPSKLTIQAGKWLGEGLVIGMNKMGRSVYKAGHNIGELATDSLSGAISKVVDFLETDMDTSPTIRPVLDLTDVTNGANRLNSLFATNQTVGLMANVGYASASMAAVGQNGGNGDVVSAINKLSKKMDNLSGSTTNINGITYDDGSAVSQAVGTLTRAMRMERRI